MCRKAATPSGAAQHETWLHERCSNENGRRVTAVAAVCKALTSSGLPSPPRWPSSLRRWPWRPHPSMHPLPGSRRPWLRPRLSTRRPLSHRSRPWLRRTLRWRHPSSPWRRYRRPSMRKPWPCRRLLAIAGHSYSRRLRRRSHNASDSPLATMIVMPTADTPSGCWSKTTKPSAVAHRICRYVNGVSSEAGACM